MDQERKKQWVGVHTGIEEVEPMRVWLERQHGTGCSQEYQVVGRVGDSCICNNPFSFYKGNLDV